MTQDIQKDQGAAKKTLNEQLKALDSKPLSDEVLDTSFSKIQFSLDPLKSSLLVSAKNAFELGYLGKEPLPNLDGLYDLQI